MIRFTEYTKPDYQAAPCHRQIAEAIDAVLNGHIKNLMVEAPPQHGKTELCSRRTPAMVMGRDPNAQVISATYNADRAHDNSRDVRNIVRSQGFRNVFPESEGLTTSAIERWHSGNASYTAAGVGTALTGRGGTFGIIDDPFKDRKEADSEVRRKDVWNWYRSVFLTRLQKDAPKIVINTRWHEDDLSGRILETAKQTGEKWHRIQLKAIDKKGQALWEERFPLSYLELLKATLGAREWSALYQQDPSPEEGNLFLREEARYYNNLPADLNVYMSSDAAVTEDESADYSEIGVWGVDPRRNVYVMDWWKGQVAPDTYIDTIVDLMLKYKPLYFASGKGVIRRAIEPFLREQMRIREALTSIEWFSENTPNNKVANLRSFQALWKAGRVYFPDNEDSERTIGQLLKHPTGVYDDAVDTCMFFGRLIEMVWGATEEPDEKPFNPDEYTPTVADFIQESFSTVDKRNEW